MGVSINHWLVEHPNEGRKSLRLFCLPYAGGDAAIFRNWTRRLGRNVEVWAAQLPGRGQRWREPGVNNVPEMARRAASEIREYLDAPFAIFGHSMGALIGFELARELQRLRLPAPAHLFVAARAAPQNYPNGPILHNLPRAEFLEALRRMQGTPEAAFLNSELLDVLMPSLRTDFQACETYQYAPGALISCPITAIGGVRDQHVNNEYLDGWAKETISSFAVELVSGDHFFVRSETRAVLDIIVRKFVDEYPCAANFVRAAVYPDREP